MRKLLLVFILLICSLPSFSQNDKIVKKKNGKYIYTGDGKWLRHTRYDSIRNFSEDRAAVKKKGKWGFIDRNGEEVIGKHYNNVDDFHGGLASAYTTYFGGWQIINLRGDACGSNYYDTIIRIDSLALGIDTKWVGYDTTIHLYKYPGTLLFEPVDRYTRADTILLVVYEKERENKITFFRPTEVEQVITTRGTEVTPVFYVKDSLLLKDVIIINYSTSEQSVFNTKAELSPWYKSIVAVDSTHYVVQRDWKKGVMNSAFDITVPIEYSGIQSAGNNYILLDYGDLYLSDTSGRKLTEGYQDLTYIGDGVFRAKKHYGDQEMLLLNTKGEVKQQLGYVFPYNEGFARVISSDYTKYAYMDIHGNIISPWFDREKNYIEPVSHSSGGFGNFLGNVIFGFTRILVGVSTLGASEMLGWFNTPSYSSGAPQPHETFPGYSSDYTWFYGSDFHNGYALTSVKRKSQSSHNETLVYYGVIDVTGKQVLGNEYTSIEIQDTFFVVQKSTGFGLTTRSGQTVLKPVYGHISSVGNNYFRVEQKEDRYDNVALCRVSGTTSAFITPFVYTEITDGGDSTFIVRKTFGDRGYIESNGKPLTKLMFSEADPFENGKAKVRPPMGEDPYYIDRNGKRIQ